MPAIATPFTVGGISPTATGILFWILIVLAGSAWSQNEEGRASLVFGGAPVVAAIVLGGPTAGAWVALLGTTELREIRGGVPWYGVLANHAMQVVPAILGGLVYLAVGGSQTVGPPPAVPTAAAAATFCCCNAAMALALLWTRTGRGPAEALGIPWASLRNWMVAWSAIGWLVSLTYQVVWWSPLALVAANASSAASLNASQSGWLLRHHQLTDLPNGRSLSERAADLRRTERTGLCVFYIDLDGFKAVNDTYGHDVGDDVLREVGLRFRGAKRGDDFLAHLHGDEFVLLAQGIRSELEAVEVIGRLEDCLSRPVEHAVGSITVGASVGFRLVTDAEALDAALREADRNMAVAKTARVAASGTAGRQSMRGEPAFARLTVIETRPNPRCWAPRPRARAGYQPSYSKPILSWTSYWTISPSSIWAVDFTTSMERMLRTVFEAVATAWRAASLQDRGLVPTISLMMITPTGSSWLLGPTQHRALGQRSFPWHQVRRRQGARRGRRLTGDQFA